MATYSRRERVTRTVEFTVPAQRPYGACWVEVMKAIRAAIQEFRDLKYPNIALDVFEPGDDEIRILAGDDEVIVYFEAEDGPF
jgi:hypothetical protein